MNTYTRRRGTQEAAGSESGGGGQSERSAERPAGAEWRAGENARALLVRCLRRGIAVMRFASSSPTLAEHTSVNEPLEIGVIECSALFLEIIVAARCERSPPLRRGGRARAVHHRSRKRRLF